MKKWLACLLLFSFLFSSALSEGVYTVSLSGDVPIFDGPGLFYGASRLIGEDGIYTIVENCAGEEGEVWGRLKSGLGWVNLSAAQKDDGMNLPFVAAFASPRLPEKGDFQQYLQEKSEYLTRIVFFPKEEIALFSLYDTVLTDEAPVPSRMLCAFSSLTPELPFVAGLVFYGDMTVYSVSCTDALGNAHAHLLSLSGKDGSLIVNQLY